MTGSDVIHTPTVAGDLLLEYLDGIKNADASRHIKTGMKNLDDKLAAIKPGDLVTLLARPGNGKTALMMQMAREAARGASRETGYPLVVTAEMSVEEISLRELSHHIPMDSRMIRDGNVGDWGVVMGGASELRNASPIIYVGHSLKGRGRRTPLTMDTIWNSVEFVEKTYGVRPSLVCIDYLQRIRIRAGQQDRRLGVAEIVEQAKDLALEFGVPVILASQAGRGVEQKSPPVPSLEDGKESGGIEETSDIVLGLFKPSRHFQIGETVPGSKVGLTVTNELFFVRILKQRHGEAGAGVWCYFDPMISRWADLEIRQEFFNE